MTDPTPTPLAAARHAHVLAALKRHGTVRISQLIEDLGVAPVTLRRDLEHMQNAGLLKRVHGGAIPINGTGAKEHDDDPNPEPEVAQSIAMVVPSLDYYWPGVIRGAEAEAVERGLDVLLRGASYQVLDERPILQRIVRGSNVHGLLVAPNPDTPHHEDVMRWLSGCGIPSVLVERDAVDPGDGSPLESVTTDHSLGAKLAVRHLAQLGHNRVGLIISRDSPTSRKISAGFRAACTELGLEAPDRFLSVLPPRGTPQYVDAVVTQLDNALENRLTAMVVHSDPEAMAFVELALDRGIRVPEDMSIIAYDDEVAELFTPALTAVSPPRAAVGRAAINLLALRMEDPQRPVHRVLLSPLLNLRDSTAPPREE